MKVMGLDVSTKSTGWFLDKRRCGLIEPPEDLTFPQKLSYFRTEVLKLLEKHRPEVVVIEDTYLRFQNVKTLKQLSRFNGVAMEAVASTNTPLEIMTATQARLYCCGSHEGEFGKKQVFQHFVEKYGLNDWKFDKHNDITDAMALRFGYIGKLKNEEKK